MTRCRARIAWIVAAAFAVATSPAVAADDDCPGGVVESLRVSDAFGEVPSSDFPMNVVAAACKVWPHDPGRLLVAAAWSTDERAAGDRSLHLRVAMLDTQDQHVLAGYARREQEDAGFELSARSLTLDTARYDLASDLRGFGVVVDNVANGPSCPDYAYDRELTLFAPEADKLRPVLRQNLHAWTRLEGEPCSLSAERVVTDQADLVLAMADAVHAGFRDIRLTAHITRYFNAPGEALVERTRKEHAVLRYDGEHYRPVGDRDAFWLRFQDLP